MPTFDVREYHAIRVYAPVEKAFPVLRSINLRRSRLVRALFAIRTLPTWVGRKESPASGVSVSFLEEAQAIGWVVLEETPGRELIAGAVTKPWAAVVEFRGLPAPAFVAFREPGFAKIVWTMAAQPAGSDGTLLSTETRVSTTDPVSRRKFRRYWLLFGIGIRLIRRLALGLARRELQRSSRAA